MIKLLLKLACGSTAKCTQPDDYAKDFIELFRIRNDIYAGKDEQFIPYIFGVDDRPSNEWMAEFFNVLRKNGHEIDAYTWHDYPLGQGQGGASMSFLQIER